MKTCMVTNCNKLHRCRGYCNKHYMRLLTNGTTELLSRPLASKECRHPGCNSKKRTAGYCYRHHREIVLKIPSTAFNNKEPQPCEVDDCDRFARVKGMCTLHYERVRRQGDPLTSYSRPRKSNYVSVDNIMNLRGTYSKSHDAEVLREHFSDVYKIYDRDDYY